MFDCRSIALRVAVMLAVAAPARAEPAPKATEVGRYQISAYGFSTPGGTGWGAYIIDTATGEVFHVVNQNKPELLGSVAKDKK